GRAAEVAVLAGEVVADEVRAAAAGELGVDAGEVAGHGGAQGGGGRAGRVRVAEELAEEELTGDDGAAGALAGDPTAPERLIGAAGAVEGLGEGDPAGPVRGEEAAVKDEGLAP